MIQTRADESQILIDREKNDKFALGKVYIWLLGIIILDIELLT